MLTWFKHPTKLLVNRHLVMECIAKQAARQRAMQALLRPRLRPQYRYLLNHESPSARHFHQSRPVLASNDPSKPIVLEQPDKFRPPSHAARRNARSTTAMYGGGAAYNQGMTDRERVASKTKKYPNMFPEEGTRMYWFLTTKWVHFMISLVRLLCYKTGKEADFDSLYYVRLHSRA